MYKYSIILILPLLTGCFAREEKQPQSSPRQDSGTTIALTDAQIKNAGITTGHPRMRSMLALLKVNGLVDLPPQNWVTVSFPPGGYIKSTTLLPGMRITKGQVLAVMEDPSFVQLQEDYLMTSIKLQLLQKEYDRQKLLNATKTTSDKVFEQTTGDYQSQKIGLKALREKLLLIGINPDGLAENTISRRVSIHATINGYVSAVHINPGKYVGPTDVLFELVDPGDLHLALTIFEKDLPAIHPGQKLTAWLVSEPSRTYDAQVILVGKTLDSNRSTQVHCHFTGTTPPLSPGMFINAAIQVSNREMVSVPEEAVVRSGNQDWIFVERSAHQFDMQPVITGPTQNGLVAISSAGTDFLGKTIITTNAYAALMKLRNKGEDE